MGNIGWYLKRVTTLAAGAAAVLGMSTGIAEAKSSAHINSVTTSGTSANPEITVLGHGFGERPANDPRNFPVGSSGCPNVPASRDGHLYGTALYITDLKAKKGTYTNWTGGQYTPGSSGFYDCVGLVIDQWSKTKVRFHFGGTYGRFFPGNTYFLSNGDRFQVFVRNASLTRTAKLG